MAPSIMHTVTLGTHTLHFLCHKRKRGVIVSDVYQSDDGTMAYFAPNTWKKPPENNSIPPISILLLFAALLNI